MKKYIFIKPYGTPGMLGGVNFKVGDIVEGSPAPMGNTTGISVNYFNSSTGGVSAITVASNLLKEYTGTKPVGSNDIGSLMSDYPGANRLPEDSMNNNPEPKKSKTFVIILVVIGIIFLGYKLTTKH